MLGAEGSLAIGGYILHMAANGIAVPLLGRLEAWRFAFVITALPGFVLAALAIFIHEPERTRPVGVGAGWGDVFRFMASRKAFYFCQILGFSLVMGLVYARLAWNPTFLIRSFGWSVQQAGYALGAFGLVTGVAALLIGGRIVDWMFARGQRDAHFRYYVVGGVVMGLFGVATYLAPNPTLFFVGSLIIIFPLNMGAIGASAVQVATPPHLRGRLAGAGDSLRDGRRFPDAAYIRHRREHRSCAGLDLRRPWPDHRAALFHRPRADARGRRAGRRMVTNALRRFLLFLPIILPYQKQEPV